MIFVDTNVVSETMNKNASEQVLSWLIKHDAEIALSTVVIAEIAFGIARIPPDERAKRLETGLARWRKRFAHRIFGLTEEAAMVYGDLMGRAARSGQPMSAQDGMIAAITLANGGRLATRNMTEFAATGIELISPWNHRS